MMESAVASKEVKRTVNVLNWRESVDRRDNAPAWRLEQRGLYLDNGCVLWQDLKTR